MRIIYVSILYDTYFGQNDDESPLSKLFRLDTVASHASFELARDASTDLLVAIGLLIRPI